MKNGTDHFNIASQYHLTLDFTDAIPKEDEVQRITCSKPLFALQPLLAQSIMATLGEQFSMIPVDVVEVVIQRQPFGNDQVGFSLLGVGCHTVQMVYDGLAPLCS